VDDELALAISRFDLQAYVEAKGAAREGSDEWLMFCPHCGAEKLSVNVQLKRWRCFRCEVLAHGPGPKARAVSGAGGVFSLVEWLEGWRRKDVAKFLLASGQAQITAAGPLAVTIAPPAPRLAEKRPTGLPEKVLAVTANLPYMDRRGITLEDARTFGLGYVPAEAGGWLANRLIFPVWENGVCLYWQARAMWDEKEHKPRWPGDRFRKSLNPSSERDGKSYLGSTDVVGNVELASRFPRPVIVEGPTSGVRVGPEAMWTFGKSLHNPQVARMVARGIRAVDLMWDGPTPGKDGQTGSVCSCHGNPGCAWPAAVRHASMLAQAGMDVRIVFLPRGDPGDYTRAQDQEFRRTHSRPFSEVSAWSL